MLHHLDPEYGGILTIEFECSKCERIIVEEDIPIPDPIADAERAQDSYSQSYQMYSCGVCGHRNPVTISSGYPDCQVDFPELGDNSHSNCWLTQGNGVYLEKLFDETIVNESAFKNFTEEIENIETILRLKDYTPKVAALVYKQLYSSVITILEAYLLETIVRLTSNHEVYLKRFLRSYQEFSEKKMSMSKYLDVDIKKEIRDVLASVMYHNVSKVAAIYRCAAGINFQYVAEVSKAVSVRHDLVHRNGKKISGELVQVGRSEVEAVIAEINRFVKVIESQVIEKIEAAKEPF